jgi:Zn-dependent protease/predicted transcriptional regulator
LITFSLASGFFPASYPGWQPAVYWFVGGLTAALFLGSVLVHELGHSVVAIRDGIPVRGITLFIFGGVAEIGREPDQPGSEFRIAIAGPLTSLALAAGFAGLSPVLSLASAPLAAGASYLGRINLMLALFNMIPGFPLDGGRVLRSILWKLRSDLTWATRLASSIGRGVGFLFIAAGLFQVFMGNLFNGLWIAFIGWFLNNAAQNSYQQVVIRDMLQGVTARQVAPQQCPTVPGYVQLDNLVNNGVLLGGNGCFFVAQEDELPGLITLDDIRAIPRNLWRTITAGQVMKPAHALAWASADEGLLSVLQRMDESQVNQLPVRDAGRPLGVLTREALLRYIQLRRKLNI